MVYWLGISAFTAVAGVQSLVGELRTHKLHGVAKIKKKQKRKGSSLVYQWLGLGTFTAMALASVPGWRTKILHAVLQSQNKRPFTEETVLLSPLCIHGTFLENQLTVYVWVYVQFILFN